MKISLNNINNDEIEQMISAIFWSCKGDKKSRREEIVNKSPLASIVNLIEYNLNGKPYINKGPSFSISHSLGCSALIISNAYTSIGIDIEVNRPFESWERIAKYYFLEKEQKYCADSNGLERFWQIWVKKEAILKCIGDSILENALKVDTFNNCGLAGNGKMKILYSVLTSCGRDIHVSIAYCQ